MLTVKYFKKKTFLLSMSFTAIDPSIPEFDWSDTS